MLNKSGATKDIMINTGIFDMEITFLQMFVFITILWIIVRAAVAFNCKQFSVKRELQMLLVYICIVVISRFVYFGFHLVDGKI